MHKLMQINIIDKIYTEKTHRTSFLCGNRSGQDMELKTQRHVIGTKRTTRTQLNTRCNARCFGMVRRSCFTNDTRSVTPVISNNRG